MSFLPGETAFGGRGWSLTQYGKIFGDPFYLRVLIETLGYGVAVALATVLLGFPVAHSLARMPARARRWRLALIILPLTLSLVVNVFAWLVILGGSGLVNELLLVTGLVDAPLRLLFNRGAVLVVLVHTFLPFQILSIMSVIAQIDPRLEEAAANLRANRWTTFRRVLLPMIEQLEKAVAAEDAIPYMTWSAVSLGIPSLSSRSSQLPTNVLPSTAMRSSCPSNLTRVILCFPGLNGSSE